MNIKLYESNTNLVKDFKGNEAYISIESFLFIIQII